MGLIKTKYNIMSMETLYRSSGLHSGLNYTGQHDLRVTSA